MALSSLRELHTLVLLRCTLNDTLLQKLGKSKSLLSLKLGTSLLKADNCGITDEGVKQIGWLSQLKELVLSKPSD